MFLKSKNKGFSLVELIVIIAILAVFAAILTPSLMQYTENSRAQKDVSAMDEVVNAVQLALADEKCFDEALKYSCTNNYLTYSDSSGNYGQQINDGEFWAPDGSGRATTITFNPEYGPNNQVIYDLSKGIVNDMTFGNGSVAQDRVMEGAQIDNNQCYLSKLPQIYHTVRQSVGADVVTTSQTYRNSSFTVFIRFTQKDGTTVSDVSGSFNGTNLYDGAVASKGSGTSEYNNNGEAITTVTTPGTTKSEYTSSDLSGSGSLGGSITIKPDYKTDVYYTGVESNKIGDYSGAIIVQNGQSSNTVSDGDVFVDEYYEYRYNYQYGDEGDGVMMWHHYPEQKGWGVKTLDTTLQSYGEIKDSIAGKPITVLRNTFRDCKKMTAAPTIPYGVTNMGATFFGCEELRTAPSIPDTVTRVHCIFYKCYWLKTAPKLPDGIEDLYEAFFYCTRLVEVPELPQNTKSMLRTFEGCISLVNAPQIPQNATSLQSTFKSCSKIQTAPIIPSNVTNMIELFANCTNLTGDVVIEASPKNYENAFKGTSKMITLTGDSTKLTELAATDGYTDLSDNDNVRVKDKTTHSGIIPVGGTYYVGVTSMKLGDYSGATATYTAGQSFPSIASAGDVYVYGDYEYRYNMAYTYKDEGIYCWCTYEEAISVAYTRTNYTDNLGLTDGWGIRMLDATKVNAGEILQSINNKPVTGMSYAFARTAIKTSPIIPSSITCLYSTYCYSQLSTIPEISHLNIKSLRGTFSNCGNLTTAKNMIIPSSATDLFGTFTGCSNLQDAPYIPASVRMMSDLFDGCKSLTGTITIDANVHSAYTYECFARTTKPIVLVGSSTKLNTLAATATNGNVTVK